MTESASRFASFSIWKAILASILLSALGQKATAQDPSGAEPEDKLLVRAIVGLELNFDLQIPAEVSNVSFQALPDGLQFNETEGTLTGVATSAGVLETSINFSEGGQALQMPARFEVYMEAEFPGDVNNPNPDEGPEPPTEPIRIIGKVGEQLYWQLNFNLNTASYDFAVGPDGVPSQLPPGIQISSQENSFLGYPEAAGIFECGIVVTDSEGSFTEHYIFDIQGSADAGDGTATGGTSGTEGEPHDEPLFVRGVVGYPLHFFLEVPENVELQSISPLPPGLSLDMTQPAIVGTPTTAGFLDSNIQAIENGQSITHPVQFDIVLEADFPGDPNDPNPPHDSNNPEPPAEPIRIFGKVGERLYWQLNQNLSSSTFDIGIDPTGVPYQLPSGIDIHISESSFVGTPLEPGVYDFELVFSDSTGSYIDHYIFDIAPAGDTGTPGEPDPVMVIHGVVGEPLYWQLNYNVSTTGYDYGVRPDGTSFQLPAGIEIVAAESSFIGTPSEAGWYDFILLIPTSDGIVEKRYAFDIAPANDPDEDKPLIIRAVVGFELLFPLDIPEGITLNTFSPFPAGLSYETASESVVGTPSEAGIFEALITYTEDGADGEKEVIFEIYNEAEFPGDPNDPNPPEEHLEHPFNIVGDVGMELQFYLGLEGEVGDLVFDMLPEGLSFDADNGLVYGTPIHPGFYETRLRGLRDTEVVIYPVYFDIFGDWNPDTGAGGQPHELKIFGWVGEFISFPLPLDPSVSTVSLTTYADGTQAYLPLGVQLDAANGMLVGFPQEPGFFPSSFTITEGDKSEEIPVFFEIQYFDPNDPGGPTHPGDNYDHEPNEIVLFGEVGARFSFKFPLAAEETADLPAERDGDTFALPVGLSYSAENLSITGSPTKSGHYEALVVVEGPGYIKEKYIHFIVSDGSNAPRLSFFSESEYVPGQPFSYQINAGGQATNFEVEELPAGLQLDSSTGIISGTIDFSEDFDLLIAASNENGTAYGIHFLDSEEDEHHEEPDPTDPNSPDTGHGDEEDPEPFFARLGVPFVLEAPAEFAEAVFALVDGEAFPAGLGFDSTQNAVISGTPTEAGLFQTKISITRGELEEQFTLWFFVADSVEAPQFVAPDYVRSLPGEAFELRLPIANGPATIKIQSAPDGVSYDSEAKALRGVLSEPGFYRVLVSASNEAGMGVHLVEIDVFDDGTGHNPGNNYYEPIHAFGIVGEPFDFPLPANPDNSVIAFVDGEDGTSSEIPAGLEYIENYAIIRGTPEQEGVSNLFLEITEFGFTRREQIVFEIYTRDNLPDDPNFPTDPGYHEPDDGHVEPILGKVGERLYFEAPISGDGVSFAIVDGPDGEPSELPPGVSFDSDLGILSGVPTASGIYPLWVEVDEFGSVRTHFAPVIVSGVEGSPVITSEPFFTTIPGEHFKFEIKATNEPTDVEVDFFDVPGVLSFDQESMLLEGKFEFGGFFTLLVSATNDTGTGYGLLNIDVLGLNDGEGPNEIPLHINGTVNQKVDFPLPSFIRGSKFVVTADPAGFEAQLPEGFSIDEKTGRISGIPTQPGYTFVWVSVDDGELPSLAINIGIAEGMRTPEIISPDFWIGYQDSPFHYQIHATDGPYKFYAEGLPTGLSLDPFSGTIRGTSSEFGDFQVAISAENAAGVGNAKTLYLTLEEKPRLPVVSAPYYTEGQVGESFSLQVNATEEPDFFHPGGLPAGLSIDSTNGLISGTPSQFGYFNVNLEATNQWGRGGLQIAIYIKRAALAPVYVGTSSVGGKVGKDFLFQPAFSGNANSFEIDENSPNPLPAGLAIDPETGAISGIPSEIMNGFVDVLISGEGGSTIATVYFKIVAALDAPVISSSSFAKGTSGTALSFQLTASNSPVEFAAANLPAGLELDSQSGEISGTPESAGFYDIVVSARNASGWGQPKLLILDIIPGLEAPIVISAPWAKGEVGKAFQYQIEANNQPSGYAVSGDLPEGLSLDEASGSITGTPSKAGFYEVILSASNASGSGNGLVFIFAIRPSQEMPVITSSGTAFATVNEPFLYKIKATATPTSYAAENLPDGLSLNESTGFITGTPKSPTTEPLVIVVTASNAAGQSLPRAVLLEILPAAEAPVILSGGHALGKVGVAFEYQVFAINEPTAYSSPDLPEGLSIASNTGLISGTPEEAGEFKVTLVASNDAGKGEPATILFFIVPGAEAPRVTSKTHAIGKVGEDFEYQILASAEEIDSYQVEGNLPRGLDFDPTTGLISGTPVEPIITSVLLSVSNEAGTSAPQPFTIKIEPALEAPVITSSLNISGTVGEELSYTINATNMPEERPLPPSAEFDAVGLPSGLGVNTATGIVSGIPEEAGSYIATLVASNETGEGAPRFLNIKIKPAPTAPVVTSVFRVGAQVGKSFNYQIVATNAPTSYDADHAIAWLVADTETGSLSGTPTKPGVFYASLFAVNEAGYSEPSPLEITVYPAADTPKMTSERSAEGKVGSPFEYQIEASNNPTSFKVSGLPAGLSLNPSTGVISGTPTASGTFDIVVVGSNGNGEGAKATLVLKISPKTAFTIVSSSSNDN
ncbi:putative Ig domain-containing protein [Pelagicoccus sp. NFK12]|uniref:Ig domain-containing protein n=1 Tax=Pelagicoccus enzymogenes TaxID=2773457 RepID=A0A927F8L0_9BACT|nr:Ig domain-containing protein [Pelagicoccus enzymogenes]MBD5779726.1 putative Ig domain-containing protein [Pelagicoccus enzymogenes]